MKNNSDYRQIKNINTFTSGQGGDGTSTWNWEVYDKAGRNRCDWAYGFGPYDTGGRCRPQEQESVYACDFNNSFAPVFYLGEFQDHKGGSYACKDRTFWGQSMNARCCNKSDFQNYLNETHATNDDVVTADTEKRFTFPPGICGNPKELHHVKYVGRKTDHACESHNHDNDYDSQNPCDNARSNCSNVLQAQLVTLNNKPDPLGFGWKFS
jgi:hypothetical protein